MKTVAIIANKQHKKALKLKSQLSKLLNDDFQIIEKHTEAVGHANQLAFDAIQEGAQFIIAAGGDGTINEVINGVMRCEKEIRNKIFVGLYPLGTGNDFARTVKLSKSIQELARLIVEEKYKTIDLGLLEFTNHEGETQLRYFDNIAEVGVWAKAVEIVNKSNKVLGSTLTFFFGVLKAFIGYRRQTVRIKTKDFQWSGKIVAFCVANGQYFGSGLGIAPGASLIDGQFSLVIVGNISILHFLRYLPNLRQLKKINHPEVHYLTSDACELISQVKYPVEMDGENVGFTPFKAKIEEQAIRILAGD